MKLTCKFSLSIFLVTLTLTSCNKLVDIPESKNQVETGVVFSDSATAVSALAGVYLSLGTSSSSVYGNMRYLSLYADEYNNTSITPFIADFNRGRVATDNSQNLGLWNSLYSVIYQSNSIIENTAISSGLNANTKKMLIAESKFLRAYAYLYLLNCYGRVPLLLTTNVKLNRRATQASPAQLYEQIVKDLIDAKADLATTYQGPGKARANTYAASALLARVYLYLERWSDAERESSLLIGLSDFKPLPPLTETFIAGSKEAILQIWSLNGFAIDAGSLVPATATVLPQFSLRDGLYQLFANTDGRLTTWIGKNNVMVNGMSRPYYFPYKYRNRIANNVRPEYVMALRLGEQYLIRAEALAQLGRFDEAIQDINMIRQRAGGIPVLTAPDDLQSCLQIIFDERRRELFGEWGHRFFDLRRRNLLDDVMKPIKNAWVNNSSSTLPIPNTEILYNTNLIQNENY